VVLNGQGFDGDGEKMGRIKKIGRNHSAMEGIEMEGMH
jgi:hypothetical protein